MNLRIRDDTIYRVEAPFDSAPNFGNLCVKGRFGLDFATHPRRLKKPLLREDRQSPFREASWDEALDFIAGRPGAPRQRTRRRLRRHLCLRQSDQ